MVPIGTLSHELGHALPGYYYGLNPTINYQSTSYAPTGGVIRYNPLYTKLGGPLSNMLIGSIGLLLLMLRRKKSDELMSTTTAYMLLALFWSREVIILLISLLSNTSYSDETKLSMLLELPRPTIPLVFGMIGFCARL